MIGSTIRKGGPPSFRKSAIAALLLSASALAGCASYKPPEISYDADAPPLPAVPAAVVDNRPKPLHVPPAWTPARGGTAAGSPTARVENATIIAALGKDRVQIARSQEEIEVRVGQGRVGRELFPMLILLLAIALGVETLLANRFYRNTA